MNTTNNSPSYKSTYNKFRGANGAYLSKGLFVDVIRLTYGAEKDTDRCLYYFYDKDLAEPDDTRPLLKDLFIAEMDHTGRRFANKYLAGKGHLNILLSSPWFKKEYELWVEEVEDIRVDAAMRVIDEAVADGDKTAAKFVAAKDYKKNSKPITSTKSRRGRPSLDEVNGALKQEIKQRTSEDKDWERVSKAFKVVTGGKK